jgi:hypothetical protein
MLSWVGMRDNLFCRILGIEICIYVNFSNFSRRKDYKIGADNVISLELLIRQCQLISIGFNSSIKPSFNGLLTFCSQLSLNCSYKSLSKFILLSMPCGGKFVLFLSLIQSWIFKTIFFFFWKTVKVLIKIIKFIIFLNKVKVSTVFWDYVPYIIFPPFASLKIKNKKKRKKEREGYELNEIHMNGLGGVVETTCNHHSFVNERTSDPVLSCRGPTVAWWSHLHRNVIYTRSLLWLFYILSFLSSNDWIPHKDITFHHLIYVARWSPTTF